MSSPLVKIAFSIGIILTILFFSGGNIFALFNGYFQEDRSIFSIGRDQFCIPQVHIPTNLEGKKLVVLRLDDVQGYTWRDISIKIIQDAYKFNAPIVAWVIPKGLEEDLTIMKFLKRENCNIEIAMHGWDHFGTWMTGAQSQYLTEFWNIDFAEAHDRIIMAKEVLERLSGKPIMTFIPPFNIASKDAVQAIFAAGIQVISSIWTGAYDYHSSTYNFDKKRIVPVSQVLQSCEDVFSKNWLCVIMMHPQDFANSDKTLDQTAYNDNYLAMLQTLTKDPDVTFVTFESLIKNKSTANQ